MSSLKFLQLPVPPPAYFAATGNVPLSVASLANSCRISGLTEKDLSIEVLEPNITDTMGDNLLIDYIAKSEPEFLGLSLYLWNSERSLYLAEEIKKKSPYTKIIIGGPEVNPDNIFVNNSPGFDFEITGEAEESFPRLIQLLMSKKDISSIPGLSYRINNKLTDFNPQDKVNFPLNKFPSPYLNDFIKVDPLRSTYIETVRGCRSSCTYCFYPKSSNVLRGLEKKELEFLIRYLKDKGARELVFLDPTFNHRPNFIELLDLLIEINNDSQMKMFAEIRPEGMTPKLIEKMAKAGFYRVELGMQSINIETLKRVQRFGNPAKIAEISKMLREYGIELLLDLIIGLPGDSKKDVLEGVQFFKEHGLEEWVQVFPLSILPGTKMRSDAEKENLTFLSTPPYRIIETSLFTLDDMIDTLFEAEEILDRRIDESPRPNLILNNNLLQSKIYKPEIEVDLNKFLEPTERHFSLWIESDNLELVESKVLELISKKIEIEPYCILDIVLYVKDFNRPLIIDKILSLFSNSKSSYLKLALSLRDEDLQHRLTLLLKEKNSVSKSLLLEIDKRCFMFMDIFLKDLFTQNPIESIGFRILDNIISKKDLKKIEDIFDPEKISFSHPTYEKYWTLNVLGYGE